MLRSRCIPVLLIMTLLVPVSLLAQQKGKGKSSAKSDQKSSTEQQDQHVGLADKAFANLVSWKPKAARNKLQPKQKEADASPSFKAAWALMLAEEGSLGQAVTDLDAASEVAAEDPAPKFYLGEVLSWKKDNAKAKTAWQAARDRAKALVKTDAEDARGQFYLGAALVRLQQYDEARTALEAAIAAGFDATQARYYIGVAHTLQGNWAAAKDTLSTVIEAQETFAHAYYYRALAWEKLKRKDNMLLDMDQFVKLAPTAPESGIARSLLVAAGR